MRPENAGLRCLLPGLCAALGLMPLEALAQGPRQPVPAFTPTGVTDVILGRPTDGSVVLSVLRYDRDGGALVAYATLDGGRSGETEVVPFKRATRRT